MAMFAGSKKTSESGVWIADEEATNCYCCNNSFNFLVRKHHCRQCGQVVCGSCSENRKYLESSRSGAPKRICDKCHAAERGPVDEASEKLARMEVADGGAGDRKAAPGMPSIPADEAVQALKDHPFSGAWTCSFNFLLVDLSKALPEAAMSALSMGAIKKVDTKGRKSMATESAVIKPGSKVNIQLKLLTQGAAYFKGTCKDFGQFGKEGKVTGALQRANGKVSMTIQMANARVTTSFNLVGLMNADGLLQGSFSGCEISKSAGTVSGTFKMHRDATVEEGEEEDGSGSEEKDAAPKKPATRRVTSKKVEVVESESEEEEVKPKKSSVKKPAAAEDDDTDD